MFRNTNVKDKFIPDSDWQSLSQLTPGGLAPNPPRRGEGNKPQEFPSTQSHCGWIGSAFAHFGFRFRKETRHPSLRQEYCSGTIKVGPMHESIPTMGFSKSLDLPLSFRVGDLFDWPVAFYLVLKKDVERFFFEMPFDVSGKRLQIQSLIGLKVIVCIHICKLFIRTR
jgi:hypothetical protein